MIYAEIVAGGKGTRMGNTELPKQFLMLGDKPILIHTVERFQSSPRIDRIILCVPGEWKAYTAGLLDRYTKERDKIDIVSGGEHRNATVLAGCRYIEEKFGISEEDIILTHDAVRPFVTRRVIDENIEAVEKYGAAVTAIGAVDTVAQVDERGMLKEIPIRESMYQEQTPQTFMLGQMKSVIESFTDEEQRSFTDVCKAYLKKGLDVRVVNGERFNIKITTPYDMKIAETLMKEICR